MQKVFKKILAVCICVLFSFIALAGCSKDYVLKKEAKKLNTYTIDINLDTKAMTASCYEKFEYKNNTDSIMENLVFHMYPTAFSDDATIKPYSSVSEARCFPNGISYGDMKINEVKENGNQANFKIVGQDNDKLEIELKNELDLDDGCEIEIYFDLIIPNCTHRFGYYENNINFANFYPILAIHENGEFDMTPYYSSGDPFYSECANYVVTVSCDNNFDVYSSGNKIKESQNNNIKTQCFEAKAVRDFALVFGSNFESRCIVQNDTTINYVGYKGDENLDNLLSISAKAVNFFSEIYRTYPYKELNIIKTPFVHGGMEYPGLVMISDTIEETEELNKVIVHEVAHEWWYGLVGVNETNSAWIDEGLAEYSTALFFGSHPEYDISYNNMINDAVMSYTLYVDIISSINGKINTKMNLPVNEYINEYEYTYMIYIKGILLFDELASSVGQDKLVKALSKITKDFAFSNISDDEFTECIKKYTHINTDNFFKGFLDGNVIIGKLH